MTAVDSVALETPDPAAAEAFYAAFGVGAYVDIRPATASTTRGFRGLTLSLVVPQPGNVDRLLTAALDAGATELKPVKLALYGRPALAKDAGVAPDGAGSHGIVLNGAAEPFTDPDGFAWETAPA